MKTYYVYKETFLFKFYKYVFLTKKDKILYWVRDKSDSSKYIPFPDNSQFYSLLKEARSHLESHYSTIIPNNADPHLKSYFIKRVSYIFSDYYYFRKAIALCKVESTNDCKIIGPKYLSNIFENISGFNILSSIIPYIYHFLYTLLIIMKCIGRCLLTKNKISIPDVFYYQKTTLPNPFQISEYVNVGFTIEVGTLRSSMDSNEYGINYLNNFHKSFIASVKAFILMWKYLIHDIKYFIVLNLPGKLFSAYLIDSFTVLCLVKLKPSIFFGIMEKMPFILLNRYKYKWQKTCVFSDAFVYSPVPSLDYVYADVFYTMNDIEIGNINTNGGRIDKKTVVGNIMSSKRATSRGISKDLEKKVHDSTYTVLVGTNRLLKNKYYPLTRKDLNRFLDKIKELAVSNKGSLFIIKTKKGEFRSFTPRIKNALLSLRNVYIVNSEIPSLLKHNQFEDLIQISDMLISSFFCSTIIWQALSKRIPVIACNDVHDHSFLQKYKYLEVNYDELKEAFHYWKKISKLDFENFLADIDSDTNVLNLDSLNVMLKNMSKQFTESQYLHNGF